MGIGMETASIVSIVMPILLKALKDSEKNGKISDGESIEEISKEIKQQDISLQLAKEQARFAQELAIALRIETAEEVEIEEFYDNSGEGSTGFKSKGDDLSIGVSGSGRKITKRIYKFKGHNGDKIEVYQQKLSEVLGAKTNDV